MTFLTDVSAMLLINFVLLIGLSLAISKTSILSIGQLAFFGIGAFVTGLTLQRVGLGWGLWVALALAMIATTVVAVPLAFATLRLRQDYFLVLSAAMAEAVYGLSLAWKGPGGFNALPRPRLGQLELEKDWVLIGAVLLPCAIVSAGLFYRFRKVSLERVCAAVRVNERFAATLGFNPLYYKIGCFLLGAGMASVAGVLATAYTRATDPNEISLDKNLLLFSVLLFGGLNSLTGILLGALLLTAVPVILESLMNYTPLGAFYGAQLRQLLFGLLLLLTIRKLPYGLAGNINLIEAPQEEALE